MTCDVADEACPTCDSEGVIVIRHDDRHPYDDTYATCRACRGTGERSTAA